MKLMRSSLPLLATLAITFSLTTAAHAQTFATLAGFNGNDGVSPFYGPLVQATNGNFYGTTYNGGLQGYGVLFELTPAGKLTDLYDFCSQPNCADGASPWSSPVLASDGNFYGTTNLGGNASGSSGTVFKMGIGGRIKTLYSFCYTPHPCLDGQYPNGLVQASDGNFYGTTSWAGKFNGGTVFEISSIGTFKNLYTFCSRQACVDGASPQSVPVQASNGNLYGTTYEGGSTGSGVVYEITPHGSYKVLYNFCSQPHCADGAYPFAALVEDAAGNLYGTTVFGGVYGSGTVFEITPSNQFIVLHSFDNTVAENPEAALTQATMAIYTERRIPVAPASAGMSLRSLPKACIPPYMPSATQTPVAAVATFPAARSFKAPTAAYTEPQTRAARSVMARSSACRTDSNRSSKPCPSQVKREPASSSWATA